MLVACFPNNNIINIFVWNIKDYGQKLGDIGLGFPRKGLLTQFFKNNNQTNFPKTSNIFRRKISWKKNCMNI